MAGHVGVDVGRDSFFVCLIDDEARVMSFPEHDLSLADTIAWVADRQASGACLDGPPQPNQSCLQARLPADTTRNINRRVAEFQLGIGGCYGTPTLRPQPEATNAWMASGMDLYAALQDHMGWNIDLGAGHGQLIETHPTYAFKALLAFEPHQGEGGIERIAVDRQRTLRPKRPAGAGGHAQRIKLLRQACQEAGFVISEENERRWEGRIDWVDATICALIRYWKTNGDPGIRAVGDPLEGTIYLRVPATPFTVVPHDQVQFAAQERVAPQRRRENLDPAPNAIILRLGEDGPGGLSQADTLDIAILASDEGECWIPIDTGHKFKLAEHLLANGNALYLAFGNVLRLRISTGNCVFQPTQLCPYPGQINPWPVDQARGWVEAVEVQEVNIADFQTVHGDDWGEGFTGRGANLLRARVNGIEAI